MKLLLLNTRQAPGDGMQGRAEAEYEQYHPLGLGITAGEKRASGSHGITDNIVIRKVRANSPSKY